VLARYRKRNVTVTEAILSNITRKLLSFKITKMLIKIKMLIKNKFTVLFVFIIFGTLSFPAADLCWSRFESSSFSMRTLVWRSLAPSSWSNRVDSSVWYCCRTQSMATLDTSLP